MRYALIIAGGAGSRLWPMSRKLLPKQLLTFINGQSLLQIAVDRLKPIVDNNHLYICAGDTHRKAIQDAFPTLTNDQFLGEPMGRDTLNAIGLGAAVIRRKDADAVIGVFTADHLIKPVDPFRQIAQQGYALAESQSNTLVTFGITPTSPNTGYGYLALGQPLAGHRAHIVTQFKEKPDAATAQQYVQAGPDHYLWNSGMFVWKASTLLKCIQRYCPENHTRLMQIAEAWDTDRRSKILEQVYPTLKKISIDFAVMEPASTDPEVQVAAIPMSLSWTDVGSWPAFASTCPIDEQQNALAAKKQISIDTHRTLIASSDPDHLIATIGCEDLTIVHTPDATLVCRTDRAQDIKKLYELIGQKLGDTWQ